MNILKTAWAILLLSTTAHSLFVFGTIFSDKIILIDQTVYKGTEEYDQAYNKAMRDIRVILPIEGMALAGTSIVLANKKRQLTGNT